jgi:antitoxin MazE
VRGWLLHGKSVAQQFQEHERLVDGAHAHQLGDERSQAKEGSRGAVGYGAMLAPAGRLGQVWFWAARQAIAPAGIPCGLAVPPEQLETSILLSIRLIPMAATPSRQALRRWGNSLGIRLPAAIAREARLQEDQSVELSVVEGGVLIRPVQHRLSLAERLAAYKPMPGEPTEALAFRPLGAEVIE